MEWEDFGVVAVFFNLNMVRNDYIKHSGFILAYDVGDKNKAGKGLRGFLQTEGERRVLAEGD